MKRKIYILMATYNGAKYIREQIDSLLTQSYSNFSLFICDDGSTDDTESIVSEYTRIDDRVHLEKSADLGACRNFANLIKSHQDADYIMLCDQDDVWDSTKIKKSLDLISSFEAEPTLLYSDRAYVDEHLNPLKVPIRKYEDSFKSLLCQCHIYGCTMMINRELIEQIEIPDYASMHDHWISLIAASKGRIIHLPEPLMKYRQHSGNVTGGMNQFGIQRKLSNWKKVNSDIERTINMCYRYCKMHEDNPVAGAYANIFNTKNGFLRLYRALKFGYKRDCFFATLRGLFVLAKAKIE